MSGSSSSLPRATRSKRRRIGELLVDHGVITQEALRDVLVRQGQHPKTRLGRLIVDGGHATEAQIADAVAEQLQIPTADLAAIDVPNDVLGRVSKEIATKQLCLPWFVEGNDLYLIMADPTNLAAADTISFHTGLKVRPVVAPESEVVAAVERYYAAEETSLAQFENLDLAETLSIVTDPESELADDPASEQAALQEPVVKLVNAILVDAIRCGASDIHIEPLQKSVQLRYRVDGFLRPVMSMPKRVQGKLISRIKIMCQMDISERRKPQDGRTFLRIRSKSYDLRVSTLLTSDGEKVVARVLEQDRATVALGELGFAPELLEAFKNVLKRPQGMILVTGPTGSGKTSTLYAALNHLKSDQTNIVTVEDPVEYRLEGVSQVAVAEKAGLSFAAALRSILRQDPDIVMLGEIRDLETAQIAFQAAQTGHLVLSTLHTNDAPSAATRLVEMGVPSYVVASTMIAVLAQRLARRLCACKTTYPDGSASAVGCETCRFTGFKGRLGVYELMSVTPRVSSMLLARAANDVVRRAAQATGMQTMFEDGRRKVSQGITTLDEIKRAVPPDEPPEAVAASADGTPPRQEFPTSLGPVARAHGRARVLVVDDDAGFREIMREMLEEEHYEVLTAEDGHAALAIVYKQNPDLVVTDLLMPGMDGIELLKRLRRDLSTCQIPVVLLTQVGSVDAEVQALDFGADDYIGKPLMRDRLLSRVRRALLRSRLLRGPA